MPPKKLQWRVAPARIGPAPPPPPQEYIDNIVEFLQTKYGGRRVPTLSARLLALIVHLNETKTAFYPRNDVALALGVSIYGIDAGLSIALARGLISVRIETTVSDVIKQREGIVRKRYYRPSKELKLAAMRGIAKAA